MTLQNKLDEWARRQDIERWLFVLALLTRTIAGVVGGVRGDDGDMNYQTAAMEFLSGHGLSHINTFGRNFSWLPPGMAMFYVVFFKFVGFAIWPRRIFFILLSAIAMPFYFRLAKRLFPLRYALLAALVWLLYPPQWFWGSRINPHIYAMDVLIICLYLLFVSWEKYLPWLAFFVGILWVSASFMRAEFALGVFVLALCTFLYFDQSKRGLWLALCLMLGWTAALGPWVARNYRIHHRFLLISTNGYDAFQKAYNPDYHFSGNDIPLPPELEDRMMHEPNEVDRGRLLKEDAVNFIKTHPQRTVEIVIGNFLNFWRPWLSPKAVSWKGNLLYVGSFAPLLILFLIGLFVVPYKNVCWLTIVAFGAYKCLIHIPFYTIVLQRETITPLIILVATQGFRYVIRDLS